MAKLSSDKTYVTVERGDTLSEIAAKYAGGASNYKKLAALNNISNPNLIYVGQKIKLTKSGGGGSSSSNKSTNSTKATIDHFGIQSNSDNTIFATWTWNKSHTDNYKTRWDYDTGNGVWFVGSESTSEYKQSTYSIPSNAKRVRFYVKPISTKYTKNNKETSYWTASWSTAKIYDTKNNPPKQPSAPNVSVDEKNKFKLIAELSNIDLNATDIQFQVYKNDKTVFKTGTAKITPTNSATFSCTLDAGGEYKVRCRSYKSKVYSAWSEFSSSIGTIPATPKGITVCRASSETSVYLEWSAEKTATTYELEYTTKINYFDGSDQTTTINNIETTHYEKTGLESGQEYFFRLRAVNKDGNSGWSSIKSVVVGKKPAAPTTWSSTTTAIVGEPLNLYWVHNSVDGSSQTFAELYLNINGLEETYTIENDRSEEDKDKTSTYAIDTTEYDEGVKIKWKVRTAGVTKQYGDWSVERVIDIYAPPTLELNVTDKDDNVIDILESFPFYVSALAGPKTQSPVSYHLTVTANESYETVDNIGKPKIVKAGEQVYSQHFDTFEPLLVELLPSSIDLENNIEYTVKCVVSMNSGLTAESTGSFTVEWTEVDYEPNAEISFDEDIVSAYIKPYCTNGKLVYYKVDPATYIVTSEAIEDGVFGEPVEGTLTTTGEQVYSGMTDEGIEVYYCIIEEQEEVTGVSLSVYRREFDGTFTEIATGLPNEKGTFVTDPHPALDYARYRVIAVSDTTGSISYYDVPALPVGETAIIIQWDEEWSNFDNANEDALEELPWAGSLLRLPYNIDVSDKHSADVSVVEYVGRRHPVSYYGTQLGVTSSWSVEIERDDEETLYALRRLAIWMGDVYVREPSGSGYWAHVSVSFSQTHCELTIPVSIEVTRVEGGV